MNQQLAIKLANKICELRSIQLEINRSIISGEFLIPIHLAIGHEALAVSVGEVLESEDKLLLTHRNIHYQLALNATKDQLYSEYTLSQQGLAQGKLGSMNLMNPKKSNIYTSNILGNNLAVSLGIGLASKINSNQGVVWAVTGDGAIEEGTFYESILIASSLNLPIIFLIENNFWSLGTSITERRIPINLELLANSLSIEYLKLSQNNPLEYYDKLSETRKKSQQTSRPKIIEVEVHSLGGYLVNEDSGKERYVNYHAGGIKFDPDLNNIFEHNFSDPVFVARNILSLDRK
jgi:TPP-dependent pyruvate/acetoin dehydrogenase alpha subunit